MELSGVPLASGDINPLIDRVASANISGLTSATPLIVLNRNFLSKEWQSVPDLDDLNLAEIKQNTHNLHTRLTKTARWPSLPFRILADACAVFAVFLTSSGDQRMVDLYLSLGIMISLCGLAAFAGASLQKRAGRVVVFSTELVVCLATAAYLQYLWDRPLLSRLLPFSGTVILGNWLPVAGAFFLGVYLKTERITQLRRVILAMVMVGISVYSLAKPMLGQPPTCVPSFSNRTLDFQTTNQTCSAACAASLLRMHGISASEDELARISLTRRGTHWLGVYRGLKLKTANTNWDVVAEEVNPKDLFSSKPNFGILAMTFQAPGEDQVFDPEWGFESNVGHTVLVLQSRSSKSLDVFDPSPQYGHETWNEDVLASVRQGILLRLVPRDGHQSPIEINMTALKHSIDAYPPIVRR